MEITEIREDLSINVTRIDPLEKKLKFILDEQIILIDGTGAQNTVSDEDVEADCTIIMSLDTYGKLKRKEIKPLIATLKGKLKVKGDVGLARKLKQLW